MNKATKKLKILLVMMIRIFLLLPLISSSALAADLKPYLEGQLGFASLDIVWSET